MAAASLVIMTKFFSFFAELFDSKNKELRKQIKERGYPLDASAPHI
jgi:hypothetical protein